MRSGKTILYGVIFVLVMVSAGMSGFYVASAQLNSQPPNSTPDQLRTMDITGYGVVKGEPNVAMLTLGVETQAATATEATRKNSEKMNRIIEVIGTLGISQENIETAHFNLYPVYSDQVRYDERISEIIGYRVSNIIEITITDLTDVGEVIDAAVDAGANRVQGFYFTLTEEENQSLKTLARQEAVEDAKSKADAIAGSLGLEIVGVFHISESTPFYETYRYDAAPMEGLQTPIIPGEVQVTATVQVTFIIQ